MDRQKAEIPFAHMTPGCGHLAPPSVWRAGLYHGASTDKGKLYQCPGCGTIAFGWCLVPAVLVPLLSAIEAATTLTALSEAWLAHRRDCTDDSLRRRAWQAMGRRGATLGPETPKQANAMLRDLVELADTEQGYVLSHDLDAAQRQAITASARAYREPWDAAAWDAYLAGRTGGAPHRANAYLTRHEGFRGAGVARDRAKAVVRAMGAHDELVPEQAVACLQTMAEKFQSPLVRLPWRL